VKIGITKDGNYAHTVYCGRGIADKFVDAEFIALSRTDIPIMLAEIDRIERDCRHYCDYIRELEDAHRQAESERDVLAQFIEKAAQLQIPPGNLKHHKSWKEWAANEAKRKEKK
jgi:hypothetical protein